MIAIKIDSSSICFLKKTLSSRISRTFIILLLWCSFSFDFSNRINDYNVNNDSNHYNYNNKSKNKNKNNHVSFFTSAFLIGAVNHHNHNHYYNAQPLSIVVSEKGMHQQIPTQHYPYHQALFILQQQKQQQQQGRKASQKLYKRKDTISSTEDEPNDVDVDVDDASLLLYDRIIYHNNGDTSENTTITNSRSDTMWENTNSELLEVDETNDFLDDYNNNNNNNDIVDDAWVPDSVKAKRQRTQRVQNLLYPERSSNNNNNNNNARTNNNVDNKVNTMISDEDINNTCNAQYEQTKDLYSNSRKSPYTDEEDDIIMRMGGKTNINNNDNNNIESHRKREEGYLGDCTLQEIATDYSVPVSYLADVLCTWGVPIPIDIKYTRLGDMVTGEQAFAIIEAVNTIDVATIQDRYSNMNLVQLCYEYDITIQNAFEMCIREGYNLPFGVQTCLRIEQEEELVRVLGESIVSSVNEDDDEFE